MLNPLVLDGTHRKPYTTGTRIDLSKLNHFLTFGDQPYFYQDVSYCTRMLKMESGEQIMMPNVVCTITRSTMIEQYFKHCSEDDFELLGEGQHFFKF